MTEYNLYFMHPLYGTTFNVSVDAALTVGDMLRNLRLSGFLPMKGAYKMARYERELSPRLMFSQIDQLADGDVLRLMVHDDAAADETSVRVLLNLKVPFLSEIIQLPTSTSLTAGQFVQMLCEKGVLYKFDAEFQVYKGNALLDAEQPLSNFALTDYDLLRIVAAEGENGDSATSAVPAAVVSAEMPAQLGEQLQALQQQAERQQKAIKTLSDLLTSVQQQLGELTRSLQNMSTNSATASQNTDAVSGLYQSSLEMPFEPLESIVDKILSN